MPEPIDDTTFEIILVGGDKVEIGDKESADFKPYIKLNRWEGECFIAIQPAGEIEGEVEYEVEEDKIKCKYKVKYEDGTEEEFECEFYPLEPRTVIAKDKDGNDVEFKQCELGGFEFKIILEKKPTVNTISFDIDTKGLRFSYQPPLNQEEIERGVIRPDNVVGSYAVYHATRGNMHASEADAEKYKTGIAFHLYYPYLVDADGWGVRAEDFRIENGLLTITLPQAFINSAVYPIIIDPDFGYETVGGSTIRIASGSYFNYIEAKMGSAWEMPAPGGTANYIKVRLYGDQTTDCKAFINQKDSGGAGIHGQIAVKENLSCAQAEHWEEFTLSGETLTEGVDYILSVIGSNDGISTYNGYWVRLNTNGAVASYYEGLTYCSEPNPWVQDPDGVTQDYSIYCNYEGEAAPEGQPYISRVQGVQGMRSWGGI